MFKWMILSLWLLWRMTEFLLFSTIRWHAQSLRTVSVIKSHRLSVSITVGSDMWRARTEWMCVNVFWTSLSVSDLSVCVLQVAGEQKYHPECFTCLSCRAFIGDGDTYALVERSKLYWWVTFTLFSWQMVSGLVLDLGVCITGYY